MSQDIMLQYCNIIGLCKEQIWLSVLWITVKNFIGIYKKEIWLLNMEY